MFLEYLGCLYTGSCFVQPSRPRFSIEELSSLVNVCGLNRFTTYGTFLAPYLLRAKTDPALLKLLQEMRTISYYGVPLSADDDDWCFGNGLPVTVSLFITTRRLLNFDEKITYRTCMAQQKSVCFSTLFSYTILKCFKGLSCPQSLANPPVIYAQNQAFYADSTRSRMP